MSRKTRCNGHCKSYCLLGACPEDAIQCDACGEEIEDGVEVETEVVQHGKRLNKTVVVCRGCYERFYLSDYLEELNF